MAEVSTKEQLPPDLTNEEIQRLVAERHSVGASEVTIEIQDDGKRYIVTKWPPL